MVARPASATTAGVAIGTTVTLDGCDVLLDWSGSGTSELTVARFVNTVPGATSAPASAVSTMGSSCPLPIVGTVQVTFCPAGTQVAPVAETNVAPAGRVSVMMTPSAAPGPL